MNEEAAFLRAICESPDDDTPRLVFADWLTEQGGPVNTAWAGGIRAQVWQARGDVDAALAQRSKLFETWYGQEKLHEHLGLPMVTVRDWERGFPTAVAAPFLGLRELWPKVAFRVPIRNLHVYEVSEASAAEFVTWPALSVLRELVFATTWEHVPPYDALSVLGGCAGLVGLKLLTVRDSAVSNDGVAALLDSPHLTKLKALSLRTPYGVGPLTPRLETRLRERFGPNVIDESIPF